MTNDDHDDFKAGPDDTSTIIRRLNDQLRVSLTGGKVMMTPGIIDLGLEMQARVLAAVRAFDAFTEENDPSWRSQAPLGRNEHDMGALDVAGHRIFFKHDYYDQTLTYLSDDPADPTKTTRVLTIMLADEY